LDWESSGGRAGHVHQRVDPCARRQHDLAVARDERFGRLAVDRHHPDIVIVDFQCDYSTLAAVYDAKADPFILCDGKIEAGPAVDREQGGRRGRIAARRSGRAIGGEAPVLNQQDLVAVRHDELGLLNNERTDRQRPGACVAQQSGVEQQRAGLP